MSQQSGQGGSIRIDGAAPQDFPVLADLRWQWVLENEGTPVVRYDEFVADFTAWALAHAGSHLCTVARRGDAVVGMAWLAVVPRVPSPRALVRASGDVQCVYVLPTERNSGVGGRMLGAVLVQARQAGLEHVTVHSSAGAVTAYERAGFSVSAHLLQSTLAP